MTALYTSLHSFSTIGRINPVLDSTAWKIVSAKDLVCRRPRISASNAVGARPDQITSSRVCSTMFRKVVLWSLFWLKQLTCNASSKVDLAGFKICDCSVLVHLVRLFSTIAAMTDFYSGCDSCSVASESLSTTVRITSSVVLVTVRAANT